jgi:hypothetical protein
MLSDDRFLELGLQGAVTYEDKAQLEGDGEQVEEQPKFVRAFPELELVA